jgi:tetratricopeptide (TPR) repeat protein
MNPSVKRLLPWLLLAIAAVAVVAIPAAMRIRHDRKVAHLGRMAREAQAAGRVGEAITLYSAYVRQAPADAAAQAAFAGLLFEQSSLPGVTGQQVRATLDVVNAALLRNPDSLSLRRDFVVMLLRTGQFAAARQEIKILRTQLSAAPEAARTAAGVEADQLTLLEANACFGDESIPEALALAGGLIGFDPATKSFGSAPKAGRSFTEAALLAATILLEKEQDRETAERVLQRLEETPSNDHRDLLAQARWHAAHGDAARGSRAVARAAALAPDDPAVLSTSVAVAIADRRWDAGARLAGRMRELFPDSPEGDLGLAAVAVERGTPQAALEPLRQGLERLPENPSLLLSLANVQLLLQRPDDAERTIALLAKMPGPANIQVALLESRLLIARRQWLPAVRRLEALRPLVAESPGLKRQVDLLLADCHAGLGQVDEQLAASQRAAAVDPGSLAARAGNAAALASSGRTEDALAEFERLAASLGPDRLPRQPDIWRPLLQLRAMRQLRLPPNQRNWSNVMELIDALDRAKAVPPAALATLRYDQLVAAGDRAAADAVLERAIAAHGDEPEVWERSVIAAADKGGHAAAEQAWKKVPPAIADDPRMLAVRARLAVRAPPQEAANILADIESRAAALPAEQSVLLLTAVANGRLATGDQSGAERALQAVIAKTPDDLQPRFALFELACDQRDLAKAKAAADEIGRLCGPTSATGRAVAAATLLLESSNAASATAEEHDGRPPTAVDPGNAARLETARNLLVEAEQERPGWSLLQRLLANVELQRGDVPAAVARLRKAMELGDKNPQLVRQVVSLLSGSGRFDEAREVLDLLGAQLPSGYERLSAEVDISAGRAEAAVAQAERSLASGQTIPAGDLVWFGQVLGRAGKNDLAMKAFERAVVENPRSLPGWLSLMACQLTAGDRAAAEQTLERAAKSLDPPARQLCLARGQTQLGRASDAERTFRDAIKDHPEAIELQVGLAELLVGSGRSTEALDAIRTIIASDAASEAARRWARRGLAEMAARGGSYRDVEEALAELERNTDRDGTMSVDDLILEIGILANRSEPANWRRALDLLGTLATRRRLSVVERLQRAELLDRTGRWEESRQELLPLAGDPAATPTVLAAVVDKLIVHGEPDLAAATMKSLVAREPTAAGVIALEARLAMARDDREAAIDALRRLSMDSSGEAAGPERLRMAATLMEKLGFDRAADKTFARLADQSPGDAVARAAFLARQGRAAEALDLLEATRDRIPGGQFLPAAVSILRDAGAAATDEQGERVDRWFEAAGPRTADAVDAALLAAEFHAVRGRAADAVAIYRELLAGDRLAPQQRSIVKNNLAMQLAHPETAEEAKRLIDEAIAEQGPHPSLLDTQGVVLLARGENGEAVDTLREAVLEPSSEKFLHLACALAAWEEPDDARKALREARKLGLDPRRLDADDRARLEAVEAALGIATTKP